MSPAKKKKGDISPSSTKPPALLLHQILLVCPVQYQNQSREGTGCQGEGGKGGEEVEHCLVNTAGLWRALKTKNNNVMVNAIEEGASGGDIKIMEFWDLARNRAENGWEFISTDDLDVLEGLVILQKRELTGVSERNQEMVSVGWMKTMRGCRNISEVAETSWGVCWVSSTATKINTDKCRILWGEEGSEQTEVVKREENWMGKNSLDNGGQQRKPGTSVVHKG